MTKQDDTTTDVTGETPKDGGDQPDVVSLLQSLKQDIDARFEKIDGKFSLLGKDNAGFRKRLDKLKGEPSAADGTQGDGDGARPNTPAAPAVDPRDYLRLGASMAKLNAKGQERVQAMLDEGRPLAEIANMADTILEFSAPAEPKEEPAAPKPPTQGGTPGRPRTTPSYPKTAAAWKKLKPEEKEALLGDSGFDINEVR